MSVRVVARIRPLLKHELDKDTIVTAENSPEGEAQSRPNIVRLPNPKNGAESFSFQFSSVFEPDATQQELFDAEISPTVKHLFNGFDLSIFAHGCTGTGKTHTMRGGKALADRGVIPRLLSAIFRRCKKIEKDSGGATQVEVALEYFEIYCERVYDLFEPPEKRTPSGLPIRDNNGKTVVVGLTEKPCATLKEFEQLYDHANINRSTSSTKLNAHSSRSHAVLGVKVTQTTETTIRVSRASCIDLAGSEDNRRTDNDKDRLVESNAINRSLFTLAQCVDAINTKAHRVPYRESKLTRILSLGQNSGRTVMILNLAPTRAYHLDTLSSLTFASRTKKIEVCEIENDPVYRTMVKPLAATSSIGGANIARQPLRPLAAAAHNANKQETDKKKQGIKPVKAFSVYSDTRKPSARSSALPSQGQNLRKTETHKRPAESNGLSSRAPKIQRPGMRNMEPALTKASIEALISQRIDEKLAEKALQDTADVAPALSAELQRRLNDLEQRIDARDDDEKGQGHQFLLMAKQHAVRGEDASALRMYQLAVPFFPENRKLKAKIEAVQERIRNKKTEEMGIRADVETAKHGLEAMSTSISAAPLAKLMEPLKAEKKSSKRKMIKDELEDDDFLPKRKMMARHEPEDDDDFAPAPDSDHDDSYASDSSFKYTKPARKPKKSTKKLPIFRDLTTDTSDIHASGGQTPRTTHILKIINSRDINQIKTLKGVGMKKAETIVDSLVGMDDEAVRDLEDFARLKGVGGKTVETMRMGLGVGMSF